MPAQPEWSEGVVEGQPEGTAVYRDRRAAGIALGHELLRQGVQASVVLGLSRGGVPVACEVARILRAELDVIVVKKAGSPFSTELAIGAVCADGTTVLRHDAILEIGIDEDYVAREVAAKASEAQAAEHLFREGIPPVDLRDRPVAVIDDGVATGVSMVAAIKSARARGAAYVVSAAPVASPEAGRELSRLSDLFIAHRLPEYFWAVGQFYEDFAQVSDEEVRGLLLSGRAPSRPVP